MFAKKLLTLFAFLLLILPQLQAAHRPRFSQKYQLTQVVVLSRHNIRSPLSGNGSALAQLTPHKWFAWTSGPSELSLRGGELETLFGQYFRQWLVAEKLMTENYIPKPQEMRFYANSMQRTIATAQYFSSGMLPVANVRIEHHYDLNKMDPMFEPRFTFMTLPYKQLALSQIKQMGGEKGLQGIGESLQQEYTLLEDVLDLEQSEKAKKENFSAFRTDDLQIILENFKEPTMKGSLKSANQASDAFILQYYEEEDPLKAAFGHTISAEQWEQIARIKDVYGDVLFTAPAVAVNVAHPLLKEISKELTRKNRKFTFLCGHDSNIGSLLAALDAEPYDLPNSIEKKTPIGSKLVWAKWKDINGNEYVSLDLVYQTTQQLQNRTMLSLDTPPAVFSLKLKNLPTNADGLYKLSDMQRRFREAIEQYKILKKTK